MAGRGTRRPRPPLDGKALDELALFYVGKFATTRRKLSDYLMRKLRERGWAGEGQPDVAAIAERLARAGYVDDEAFAVAKSRSLSARGYGMRRVDMALRAAGVEDDDAREARTVAAEAAVDAALRFARRRRLGPFGAARADPREREKQLAAMLRAGHPFPLARALLDIAPGQPIEAAELAETLPGESKSVDLSTQ